MSGLIRIKTADLLFHPEILAAAKAMCTKITFEKDEVAFDPYKEQFISLVVMLSEATVAFSTSFSKEEKAEVKMVREVS